MLECVRRLFKKIYIKRLVNKGLKLGKSVDFEKGVNIDANFPWLIEIGNNVILAPWVYIVAHDAACRNIVGMTRIGKIKIGDNVYIGAKTTILPGVEIGKGSIIGANSLVNKNIPPFCVAAGNPAKVICSIDEYKNKYESFFNIFPKYSREYTLWGGVNDVKKKEMAEAMTDNYAFINTDE